MAAGISTRAPPHMLCRPPLAHCTAPTPTHPPVAPAQPTHRKRLPLSASAGGARPPRPPASSARDARPGRAGAALDLRPRPMALRSLDNHIPHGRRGALPPLPASPPLPFIKGPPRTKGSIRSWGIGRGRRSVESNFGGAEQGAQVVESAGGALGPAAGSVAAASKNRTRATRAAFGSHTPAAEPCAE